MKSLVAGLCVFGAWAVAVGPASAGWDNVFQPTLFGRLRKETTTKYYVAPVVVQYSPVVAQSPPVVANSAPCDPCQKCTTQYIQRSYYQPVTTMETRTEMVPVTTYRSSYYYEPVTSYRYSSYYDPCSCTTTQVAVPSVSYQLREQKCPVQSWVSRCVQVPVQSVQKVDYWQPQTTCCSTTVGAPIFGSQPPPQGQPPVVTPNYSAAPQQQAQPPVVTPNYSAPPQQDGPPSISGNRTQGMANPKQPMWDSYYPPMQPNNPDQRTMPGTSYQPQLGAPVPMQPQTPAAPQPLAPPVKFDRIAVGPNSQVEGQVVRSDNSPKASAKILFVNASTGQRQTVYANTAGRFQAELTTGSWLVYLHGANDLPLFHSRIDMNGAQTRQVNLVSRSN